MLNNAGQILTTRKTILGFIHEIQSPVTYNTVELISEGLKGRQDYLRLYSVCARLYYLSKLVYKGKGGIRKLDAEQYRKLIFIPMRKRGGRLRGSLRASIQTKTLATAL